MGIPLYSRLRTPVNEQVDNEFGSFCGCHDTEMTDLLISKCNFAAQSASVVVKTLFRSRDQDRDLDKINSSALESRDHGLEITTLQSANGKSVVQNTKLAYTATMVTGCECEPTEPVLGSILAA